MVLGKLTKTVTPISWWLTKVIVVWCYTLHPIKTCISFVDTAVSEVEECFKRFVKRDDIDIILINQNIAELIRHVIDGHTSPVPAVLEIPSKDHPYDASKDSILRRAKVNKQNIVVKNFAFTKYVISGHVQSRRYVVIMLLFFK